MRMKPIDTAATLGQPMLRYMTGRIWHIVNGQVSRRRTKPCDKLPVACCCNLTPGWVGAEFEGATRINKLDPHASRTQSTSTL